MEAATLGILIYVENPQVEVVVSNINASEVGVEDAVFMESFRMSFVVGYVTIASLSCDSPWRRAWLSVVDDFNRMMRSLSP